MNASEPSGGHARQIADFIAKWSPGGAAYALNEEQGAQQHFLELCALLGVAPPGGGDDYLFEKGTLLHGRRRGYADVFKRGCFAWENKAPGKPLDAALRQLMSYALALDNPPLLIVSDRLRVEIHTHFNGTPSERHTVTLAQLADPAKRELLRRCFEAPESFRPARTNRQITEEAANAFATTAERLRAAGIAPETASHLLTQCLFCFFAEDVGLLPGRLFERLVGNRDAEPDALRRGLQNLFTTMRDGGLFGADSIAWFNGGLFKTIDVPPLTAMDVAALRNASALDWSAIDPSILGTLFVRGLDPKKRAQLGAQFTDPATILRLVEPVIQRPLKAEWEQAKLRIAGHMARHRKAGDAEYRKAHAVFVGFLERLRAFRVLDPACGSGNFLYLALKALKDIEHQANIEAETLGLQRQVDAYTSPANVLGIEIDEYAAELARVTVWIGELQWRLQHGYPFKMNPVLDPLDQIECRDALMNADGSEAEWPEVDVVVGNPPFLGDKRMRAELGDAYTGALRRVYADRVPGGADLVCYWFEKARRQIELKRLTAAGLVATNSIRQGANREVLQSVLHTANLFEAWSDLPWVNEGAAVRVSLVCFASAQRPARLDGREVQEIFADLKAHIEGVGGLDLTQAKPLSENADATFFGFCLAGPFVVDPGVARGWLRLPANPNGRPNCEVLKPIWNGADVTRRPADRWAVDFGATMSEADAAMYEKPFEYVVQAVRPARKANKRASRARYWWRHGETRPGLRRRLAAIPRMIVTSETAKHRYFVWLPVAAAPEHKLVVIPRSDDVTFGLLSSRFHVLWALRRGSTLEDRPVYTTSACFEPFAFPAGLTPADTAHQKTETTADGAVIPAALTPAIRLHAEAIAGAARRLNDLRERWLNPPEWTQRVPEVVPLGMDRSPYPDRIVPRAGFEKQVAVRTLTKLYNERPTWLVQAHEALDAAVAAAYGWIDYTPQTPDEEILQRLLRLNRGRAA
ncbi:MAG: class I SAM-dependent DNA methyltransferase [Burkholderiales bacterium]|nr:class I SAM-dependent DNA methyltransferase [Burkholderiales bacterium]